MKKIKNLFLNGLLYIVPLAALIFVITHSIKLLNSILGPLLPDNLKFLGIVLLIVIIIFVGIIGNVLISSPLSILFKNFLNNAPLLKTIYSSVKDLMNTFVGDKKGFSKPVIVKMYENSSIERIGFITNENLKSLKISDEKVLVYFPHSYAWSGDLFLVDKSYVSPLDSNSSEVMKLIVSGGVTTIEN